MNRLQQRLLNVCRWRCLRNIRQNIKILQQVSLRSISYTPGFFTLPPAEISLVPVLRPTPTFAYSSPPSLMIGTTAAMDSTLFTTVWAAIQTRNSREWWFNARVTSFTFQATLTKRFLRRKCRRRRRVVHIVQDRILNLKYFFPKNPFAFASAMAFSKYPYLRHHFTANIDIGCFCAPKAKLETIIPSINK